MKTRKRKTPLVQPLQNFKLRSLGVLFFLAFLFGYSLSLQAQLPQENTLKIDNYNGNRRYLRVGDEMRFRQKNNPYLYNATLLKIDSSSVVFDRFNTPIPLTDFDKVYFYRPYTMIFKNGFALLSVGFLTSFVNSAFKKDKPQMLDFGVITSTFALGSFTMHKIRYKRYNLNKKARMTVISF
jgi:hypothetical protein